MCLLPLPMLLLLGLAGFCPATRAVQVPTAEVANGVHMPVVSLGTGILLGRKAESAVETWIGLGGAGIDTAFIYFNQGAVGKAISESKQPRESLFVTTKIPGCVGPRASWFIDQDLHQLGVDYIDLLLIHAPLPRRGCASTWKVLEEYHARGALKAIGVSNFKEDDFQAFLPSAAIVPAVNQVELNILHHDDATIGFCAAHNITVQSWSPLGGSGHQSIPHNEVVQAIAASHNVTTYQIALKWVLQHGHILTFLSASTAHQQSDADLFHFELTAQEMSKLDALQVADEELVIAV